jgi:alpha-L-fucosidase
LSSLAAVIAAEPAFATAQRSADSANASALSGDYKPTVESLSTHPLPEWYRDAKFGIFIHWGPTAVPAQDDWYMWSMNQRGSSTWNYHRQKYGENFNYDDFFPMFTAANYDPKKWVELFEEAGAKYFVLTAKHHDGYALFPSQYTDRDSVAQPPHRDLVGELIDAAKEYAPDLRRGLYYSMPEWYNPSYRWGGVFAGGPPHNPYTGKEIPYTGYIPVDNHVKDFQKPQMIELIDRYAPQVLWCDIGGPNDSLPVIAHLYNKDPEAVVNDRSGAPVHDFVTPEQYVPSDILKAKWETCDVINSWFYMDPPYKNYTAETVIEELTDVVSKNGNLLIDIAPKPDGTIPDHQVAVLRGVGEWLRTNGEAIYGATYWTNHQDSSANVPVRLTVKRNAFYVTAFDWPGATLDLDANLVPTMDGTQVHLLGTASSKPLSWRKQDSRIIIDTPVEGPSATHSKYAYTFKITTPGMSYVRAGLDSSTTPTRGQSVSATVTVTNVGGKDAGAGKVTISTPDGISAQPSSFALSKLNIDESATFKTTLTTAPDMPYGNYKVTLSTSFGGRPMIGGMPFKVAPPNVAAGKATTQSSTDFGGTPDRAVDGNTDGSYFAGSSSHTGYDQNAWWQVDLGKSYQIYEIDIWNRTDGFTDRLSDYYVLVSDEPFTSTSLDETLNQPGVWSSRQIQVAGRPTAVPVAQSGRYVRIQLKGTNWLTLPEVQVFGE